MTTLGEDMPRQQARVRGLLGVANQLKNTPGVNMNFCIAVYESTLKEADEAVISGDLPRMIRAYSALKECE